MRPRASLDDDALRANVRAFVALGAPVVAVVKQDGYGWGAARLAAALDGVVAGYVVADADEYDALRPSTALPIRLLADAPPERVATIIAGGGIPNVSSVDALAAAEAAATVRGGPVRVRVGIVDATGWSRVPPDGWPAFVTAAARSGLALEVWTHLTSPARAAAQRARLDAAAEALLAAGATVVSRDVASTATASRADAGDRLRIGVGLFGAALGAPVALRCAIRLEAPVVRRLAPGTAAWAGYGDVPLDPRRGVTVLRCGYGDGYPKMLAGSGDIVSVGMQYTTRYAAPAGSPDGTLIGPGDDLDALAALARISPHELVVGTASGR